MNSTVDLLAGLRAHLAEFELPASASVHVTASISAPQVIMQLVYHEPSAIAQALLTWADTLTDVTVEAWRAPRGDSAHLSVTGLLPGGASIQVYGDLWGTHRSLGADLAPDATTTIPLAALRHAATIKEATD